MSDKKLPTTEEGWRQRLGDRYKYLREKATETPFTGKLLTNKKKGAYVCGACGGTLFASDTKYDSGSGWPSFWDVAKKGVVDLLPDNSSGMSRTEVVCANCKSHLGHLFSDGPKPTGQRYCINSAALDFRKK